MNLFLLYLLALGLTLHPDYSKRIQHDLLPFSKGITPQLVNLAAQQKWTCRVMVRDGCIDQTPCQLIKEQYAFYEDLAPDLPDMDFVVNYIDQPRVLKRVCEPDADWKTCACDPDYVPDHAHGFFIRPENNEPIFPLVPLFSGCTISQCFADILMPSFYHIQFGNQTPAPSPWQNKTFGAVWRGTSTGGRWSLQWPYYDYYHRHKLVRLCQKIPDCDAKFAGYLSCSPQICKEMEENYGPPNFMWMDQQFKKKIVIDIDGNTFSRRFPFYLFSGSVVFKIAVFEDIGNIITRPWEHYIPIKMDLSDFEEKLEWARTHDKELSEIGERGKKLALAQITFKMYREYMLKLLLSYYDLLLKGGHRPSAYGGRRRERESLTEDEQ